MRQDIKKIYGIDLDFQEWHENYYSAFTYVKKYDSYYVTSENHPTLDDKPRTTNATTAKRSLKLEEGVNESTKTNKKQKVFKNPRLTLENVGDIVKSNNITTLKQLQKLAKTQEKEGKKDLQNFMYKHPNTKPLSDLIKIVWDIEGAEDEITRQEKSRLQLLQEAKVKPCDVDSEGNACNGTWLPSAIEILEKNNIDRKEFSTLVLENLKHGRGKGRNLMIVGPTNCGKSFIFMPLTIIYKCFNTPSQGTYNWVDAPEKEVVFLNDIRYDHDGEKRVMPWNMFLNLLEGATVNISMPKSFYAKDYEWSQRQPIFATSDKPIVRIRNETLDEGETQQMAQRWKILKFNHQFLDDKANYNLINCGACFSKLILDA